MTAAGNLYVISAPSGAGKTSLTKAVVEALNRIDQSVAFSVSTTTRAARPGEHDGEDYFFADQEQFKAQIADGDFLEHAEVFGNFYGTSNRRVQAELATGKDVILEIDWQGAEQVRKQTDECISIFILPPSLPELESRLRGRGQDSDAVIERRMRDAVSEMSHYAEFDYLIVNDDFSTALAELESVFLSQRLAQQGQAARHNDLITSLLG